MPTTLPCPFCQLYHDPEKTHCNDPHTGALIRRAGPVSIHEESAGARKQPVQHDLCVKLECNRLVPAGASTCPHCGTYQLRRRPDPIRTALTNIVDAVRSCIDVRMPTLDAAMMQAELALRPCAEPPVGFSIEPKRFTDGTPIELKSDGPGATVAAAFQSIHPDNPPPTCIDFLGLARDSMDAAVAELQAANKDRTCGGLASLLLLDLIRESSTMAFRIRAVLNAASNEAGAKRGGVNPMSEHGQAMAKFVVAAKGGKGTEAP